MTGYLGQPSGPPREIIMERSRMWNWRVIVIGFDWSSEHRFLGPKWLAHHHVRHLFHRLQRA